MEEFERKKPRNGNNFHRMFLIHTQTIHFKRWYSNGIPQAQLWSLRLGSRTNFFETNIKKNISKLRESPISYPIHDFIILVRWIRSASPTRTGIIVIIHYETRRTGCAIKKLGNQGDVLAIKPHLSRQQSGNPVSSEQWIRDRFQSSLMRVEKWIQCVHHKVVRVSHGIAFDC